MSNEARYETTSVFANLKLGGLCVGVGLAWTFVKNRQNGGGNEYKDIIKSIMVSFKDREVVFVTAAKVGGTLIGLRTINSLAKVYWMTDKIVRSNHDLKDWIDEWELIHSRAASRQDTSHNNRLHDANRPGRHLSSSSRGDNEDDVLVGLDKRSRILLEHAMKHGRRSYFWRSTGEIRFLMLKRFMDVYYASVGTAINTKQTSPLALPLVTGAAASFYSITGVSKQCLSELVNDSSRDLIQHAW
jgi:hypothetical protein